MIGWIALAALVALFAWLAWGSARRWRTQQAEARNEDWRSAAEVMGFAYSTSDASHELEAMEIPFLADAETASVAPVLSGPSDGGRVRVFPLERGSRRYAVGVVDLTQVVTAVGLRPTEGTGPEVLVGYEPVDTGVTHIDARYEVRAADAAFARELLQSEVGAWLAGDVPDWSFELSGGHLLAVGPEVPPSELVELVAVLEAFRGRLPWAPGKAEPVRLPSEKEAASGEGGSRRKRRRKKR